MKKFVFNGLGENEMPIGGYISPTPYNEYHKDCESLISDEIYKKVKETGINFLICFYESLQNDEDCFFKSLNLAEKYNLRMLIRDDTFYAYKEFNEEVFKKSLEKYKDYSSFAGFHTCDEPGKSKFKKLKEMSDSIEKLVPDKISYVNLFPFFAEPKLLMYDIMSQAPNVENYSYNNYLNDYVDIVKPKYLSFDYYPLTQTEGKIYPDLFKQINIIRKVANKVDIPFWCFVQTTNWWPPYRKPIFSEIQFQVNISLAFGAKGIQYFPLFTPNADTGAEKFNEAVFDLHGNITTVYEAVKYANLFIKKIEKIMMDCTFEGIIPLKNLPNEIPNDSVISEFADIEKIEAKKTIVSCHKTKEGKEIIFVVNCDLINNQKVVIKFNNNKNFNIISNCKVYFCNKSVCCELNSGEALLIEVKKE